MTTMAPQEVDNLRLRLNLKEALALPNPPAYNITIDLHDVRVQGYASAGLEDWAVENGFARREEHDHGRYRIWVKGNITVVAS